jgi:hypothetical protein
VVRPSRLRSWRWRGRAADQPAPNEVVGGRVGGSGAGRLGQSWWFQNQ